eukprot:7193433-Prymnesium_polylepis.2
MTRAAEQPLARSGPMCPRCAVCAWAVRAGGSRRQQLNACTVAGCNGSSVHAAYAGWAARPNNARRTLRAPLACGCADTANLGKHATVRILYG